MKAVAFNGSPRRDGNTSILLKYVLKELEEGGIETELVQLAGKKILGCVHCQKCWEARDRHCANRSDYVNACIDKMLEADAIIFGSPTYCAGPSTQLKALMDRSSYVAKANDDMFKYKVGAAVVAAYRSGTITTLNAINNFFTIEQMIIPGSSYWNLGYGRDKGEVEEDKVGIRTMRVLGQNMAWLLKKLHG